MFIDNEGFAAVAAQIDLGQEGLNAHNDVLALAHRTAFGEGCVDALVHWNGAV